MRFPKITLRFANEREYNCQANKILMVDRKETGIWKISPLQPDEDILYERFHGKDKTEFNIRFLEEKIL